MNLKSIIVAMVIVSLVPFTRSFGQDLDNVKIGMSIGEFQKIFPDIVSKNADINGQFARPEIINGLTGDWSYTFKEGLLDWCSWSSYVDKIDNDHFESCYGLAQQLIGRYRKMYGEPLEHKVGTITFRDPLTDYHTGYNVVDAYWLTDAMKFHIGFNFMGGKQEYHFIVKMIFFKKDYPYWD